MTPLLQDLVVAAIVLVATGYAAMRLLPRDWRSRFGARAARLAIAVGLPEIAARRVEAKVASGGACGSCDSCRACAAPAIPDTAEPVYRTISITRAR